jgi:site-specific DNA-methyltransferase (adenine-specific)
VSFLPSRRISLSVMRYCVGALECKLKREKAQMGIFITLTEPTKPMLTEAVEEGSYETPYGKYLRLQILTIEELLNGK